MTTDLTNKLIKSFSKELRPLDLSPLWIWLAKNVTLPNVFNPQGKFRIDNYPYLKEPMIDILNNNIKQLNLVACTQAGKSLLQQLYFLYIILENPGPILMIHDNEVNAKRVIEERIVPLMMNNPDTKRLLENKRYSAKKSGFSLPHMTCRVDGPAEGRLHGYSAKIVLADEVWQFQASHHYDVITKLKRRQTAYNSVKKMVLSSQPDYEGSDLHKEVQLGNHYEYGWRCPECNELQLYEWNGETNDGKFYGMVMDKTKHDENDIPDYNKKASSSRLVCQHCFHEIKDTPINRKSLVIDGDYILVHKGNDDSIKSYSWNQFMNVSISFKEISMAYLEAVIQQRTTGLRTKHELFRQQVLGKFWKMGQQIETKKLMVEAYNSSDLWKDETIRFLTMDVQQSCIHWLIRAWSNKLPESRLIDHGTIIGFSEVDEIVKKYNIHPLCIGIDSGFATKNIYAESIQRGKIITTKNGKKMLAQWTCLKGDGGSGLTPKKFYKHKIIQSNGNSIELDKLYSPVSLVDPMFPVGSKFKSFRANLYAWSNYSAKFLLERLRDHKLPFDWKLNERANADYNYQMFSEELSSKTGRYEKVHDKNHMWDLECMQLIMSLQSDCFHPRASELNDITSSPELKA